MPNIFFHQLPIARSLEGTFTATSAGLRFLCGGIWCAGMGEKTPPAFIGLGEHAGEMAAVVRAGEEGEGQLTVLWDFGSFTTIGRGSWGGRGAGSFLEPRNTLAILVNSLVATGTGGGINGRVQVKSGYASTLTGLPPSTDIAGSPLGTLTANGLCGAGTSLFRTRSHFL